MAPIDNSRLRQLHLIAWIEGISYLFLFLVSMPLKYFFGIPEVNFVAGVIHGILFLLFSLAVLQAKIEYRWSLGRAAKIWLTAFVPFGMMLVDRLAGVSERTA
jgi:integral membrane protein